MSFVDKRRTQRYDVEQPIEIYRGDAEFLGMTTNLSLGGASVRVDLDPPGKIGERVRVSFRIPQLEDPIVVTAEIRWRDGMDAARLGLQFMTGLRAKQTWALGRYFETLQAQQQAEP